MDFPIKNGGSFHSYVSLPEGNTTGPEASLNIDLSINSAYIQKILQDGIYHRSIDIFLVCLYGSVSRPCTPGKHQNSWDLWMFIPVKMVLIGIDPYPYVPLGISHGRCPPLIVPYPPSKHVAKGSPWAPWAPKKREKRCGKSMRNQGTQTGSTRKFKKIRFGDFDGFCDCEKI